MAADSLPLIFRRFPPFGLDVSLNPELQAFKRSWGSLGTVYVDRRAWESKDVDLLVQLGEIAPSNCGRYWPHTTNSASKSKT